MKVKESLTALRFRIAVSLLNADPDPELTPIRNRIIKEMQKIDPKLREQLKIYLAQ